MPGKSTELLDVYICTHTHIYIHTYIYIFESLYLMGPFSKTFR